MDQKAFESLVERVAWLEDENRRLHHERGWFQRCGLAGAAVFVTVALMGAADAFGPGTFRPGIVVQDPKTGARIVDLVATDSGAGGFQVWDRAGRRRILLGTNDQGQAGLTFWDEKGTITDRFWQGQTGTVK